MFFAPCVRCERYVRNDANVCPFCTQQLEVSTQPDPDAEVYAHLRRFGRAAAYILSAGITVAACAEPATVHDPVSPAGGSSGGVSQVVVVQPGVPVVVQNPPTNGGTDPIAVRPIDPSPPVRPPAYPIAPVVALYGAPMPRPPIARPPVVQPPIVRPPVQPPVVALYGAPMPMPAYGISPLPRKPSDAKRENGTEASERIPTTEAPDSKP